MDAVSHQQVRAFRLAAHHLDRPLPEEQLLKAAGACGLQNSPPGAWHAAVWNRLEHCTAAGLDDALYRQKTLLQAFSIRGVPLVFPTGQAGVFLSALQALPAEQPWIYTRGITAALDFLGLGFEQLWPLVRAACAGLGSEAIVSKEELDRVLAGRVQPHLPAEKQALWAAPSMYGSPGRQTVGGAVVSFLLRPCSFAGLVAFGVRQGQYPTFVSPAAWLGGPLPGCADAPAALAEKFLHCYGPAAKTDLAAWLGACPQQAGRLWAGVQDRLAPVKAEGKTRWLLARDLPRLLGAGQPADEVRLLGPHDPYLDLRDRAVILPQTALHRQVWQTVANPGVVLRAGRVAGVWRTKNQGSRLWVNVQLFEPLPPALQRRLRALAGQYAAFRGLELAVCTLS